jgi:HPt (histidine-containing phosphotransfer) domain-containing protein
VAGSDADRWRRAGMDDYVIKPFTIKTIAGCLSRWVGKPPAVAGPAATPPEPQATDAAMSDAVVAGDRPGEDVPLLDQTILAELGGDGSDLVKRVSRLFIDHVPGALAEIDRSAGGDDVTALADAVHALKSMCANIGAARAAAACHHLETLARTGQAFDAADHVAIIAREAQAALAEVARLQDAA